MTLKVNPVTLTLYSSPVRAIPQPSARRAVKLKNPPAVRPVHLKNPFPQPFYTACRHQAAITLGPKARQPSHRRHVPRSFTHNKKSAKLLFSGFHGDPRGIRTPDTLIRSQVLYPAELLGQIGRGRGTQTPNLRFWRPLLYQLRYAPRRMFLATVLS